MMEMPANLIESPSQPVTEYFTGNIPRLKLPASYQFSLLLVAFAMVLLPGVYLGFMGGLVWGIWWWATHATAWFFPVVGGRRRIFFGFAILYLISLFAGALLLLFMFKNFFSKWRIVEFAVPISHEQNPELFRFLGQLCRELGAPIPSRVDVNQSLGASAGFRAGLSSLFGNDIMLTFGLPLAATMSCQQFAAVIAHEFAHFTQRWAMRSSFLIHSVQRWLMRAVYERDDFDQALYEGSNESALGVVLFGFARLFVTLTRGVMWLLMVLGHALSSYMSRQMEFHADAVASAVAGSAGFMAMFTRLRLLEICEAQAHVQLKNKVTARYPDDIATYLAMLVRQTPGEMQGKLLEHAVREKTRWYESHPVQMKRIERVWAANHPGIIHDDRPATILFGDFQSLSRSLTLAGYQLGQGGKPVREEQIFKVKTPVAETAPDTSVQEAAIENYFEGLGLFLRPLSIGSENRLIAGSHASKTAQIQQAQSTLEQGGSAMREKLMTMDAWRMQLYGAAALVAGGLGYSPEAFPLVPPGLTDFEQAQLELDRQQALLEQEIEPFERAAKTRLLTALGLLRTPALAAQIPGTQQLQDEIVDLTHTLGKLAAAFPKLLELRLELGVMRTLEAAQTETAAESLEPALLESARKCTQMTQDVQTTLGVATYPFTHVKGRISLAEYARTKAYDTHPVRMAELEAESHLQMLFSVYHRALGRLVEIASMIEEKLS